MRLIFVNRSTFLRTVATCHCLLALGGSSLYATVFDGGAATTDYNTPANWEGDALPGTVAAGEFAVIGQAGVAGDGIPYLNPAVVELSATPVTPNLPGDLRVGNGPDGDGTLNHSAGELTIEPGKWSGIGQDGTASNPSIGRYNLSGTAKFNSGDPLSLGVDGGPHAGGSPNQGFVSVADSAELNVGALNIGRNDGNYGELTQTGGTVHVGNWIAIGAEPGGTTGLYNMSGGNLLTNELTVGEKSDGTLNLSGDAAVVAANMRVGRNPGGTGSLSITGDQVSLTADQLTVGGEDGNLSSAQGTLNFVADAAGVSAISVLNDVTLNDGSVSGIADLLVDMSLAPAGDILLIDVGGALNGTFAGLPEGAAVPGSGGRFINYTFGDGNDIALVIPEPSAFILCLVGLGASLFRRKHVIS